MKKIILLFFIIAALVITAAIVLNVEATRKIDWQESFNEKSDHPYGLSVFYKELPNLFKNNKVRTVYHLPSNYLKVNSRDSSGTHTARGTYIIIGNSNYLDSESIDELLDFVSSGNTLFISDYDFPQKIHDTLNIAIEFTKNTKDSISYQSLKYRNAKDIIIDKNEGDYFFSTFDTLNHVVLGHTKIDYKRVNFIQIPFGKGHLFLHLEPKAFTNYNILKANRYKYVEGVISYLPESDLYFDAHEKIRTPYNRTAKRESNLSWFLEQLSFRWAWYTALIFAILFVIFNAKRRQRIIKIINPLQNTTLNFVKTVSNLYYETQDHKNLVDKKITYFLEHIRTTYNINTSVLDDVFVDKLTSKTGKNRKAIKSLVNYINNLRAKTDFLETDLIELNKRIENLNLKNHGRQ